MSYLLESITEADKEKIVNDAVPGSYKQLLLRASKNRNDFPKTWAINREKGHYVFLAPLTEFAEVTNRPYYAFMQGTLYQFNSTGSPANTYYFVDDAPAPHLQEELKAALLVFGRWGREPKENEKRRPATFIDH